MAERPGLPRQCSHSSCSGVCEVNFGTREFRVTCLGAPLQIEGRVDGVRFYFRARHNVWRLEVHPDTPHQEQIGEGEGDEFTVGQAADLITNELSGWLWPKA